MGFWEAIGSFFKNYVTFSGRASRSECWYVLLFAFIIGIMIGIIGVEEEKNGRMLYALCNVILFLPSFALSSRRLHDVGWSAWWMVLILPMWISPFFKGTEGENRFGADPLQKNLDSYYNTQKMTIKMDFFEAIRSFFRNYITFSGRASRLEYWYIFLFLMLLIFIISSITIGYQQIGYSLRFVFDIVLFLPSLSLNVRRLHDINWSGWWVLLIFPIFIAMFVKGTKGANRFGADPLGENLDPYDTYKQRQNFNPYVQK